MTCIILEVGVVEWVGECTCVTVLNLLCVKVVFLENFLQNFISGFRKIVMPLKL